jgi:hypothetical protein
MPAHNILYKALGFKWLNQVFCPASAFVSADRNEARNPQRFIVCREAEHRQNIVLHAVVKMVETVVS